MSGMNYERQRQINEDVSGALSVTASTDDTTLKTARNSKTTIFVQKLHVRVTGSSATTWSIEDSDGVLISGSLSTASAPVEFTADFGPMGRPLTEGANLVLNVGAAGASGSVTWEAYQRLTGIGTINTAGAVGVA